LENLYQRLSEYAAGSAYPLHMPGHKRRAFGVLPPEVFRMDITEIDGFDNLHEPVEILKDLQERAAMLYGADQSYCLVGGSTCGILSAISAALPVGGHLLMARNCHKSAYHAVYLRRLKVSYLWPKTMADFGICDSISAEQVRKALEKNPDIGAVLIVSPTYEGRISPIREIAQVVHSFGKILIVDEAHGAHLGPIYRCRHVNLEKADSPSHADKKDSGPITSEQTNCDEETESCGSCMAGADLVINSIHKTLPALTQTALLHVNGERVDRRLLERYLRIYQSSSPSYILMAGIDNCLQVLEQDGKMLFREFYTQFYDMMMQLAKCRKLRFLAANPNEKGGFRNSSRQDIGKLCVFAGEGGMNGQMLYTKLRTEYGIQPEMAAGDFCLLMFTVGDSKEGYERTAQALQKIDAQLLENASMEQHDNEDPHGIRDTREVFEHMNACTDIKKDDADTAGMQTAAGLSAEIPVWQAWDLPYEEVPLTECAGRVAAEFVNLYPPGIPIVVPGECYTEEICKRLAGYVTRGLQVQGIQINRMTARCVKDNALLT